MVRFLMICVVAVMLAGCNSQRQIVYLQDMPADTPVPTVPRPAITIAPGDRLAINVSSEDPQLCAPFNLRNSSRSLAQQQASQTSLLINENVSAMSVYIVDEDGCIDYPVLGLVPVAGLSRAQLARRIKQGIVDGGYIADPVVTADVLSHRYYVMGEVSHPGQFNISTDRVTILEALANAGDLTIVGSRDKVYVIRDVDGSTTRHRVDLRSAELFASPAFNILPGDVIYVEPNKVRTGQSTVNENNWKSTGFWMSLATFALTIALFFR